VFIVCVVCIVCIVCIVYIGGRVCRDAPFRRLASCSIVLSLRSTVISTRCHHSIDPLRKAAPRAIDSYGEEAWSWICGVEGLMERSAIHAAALEYPCIE
jgi:hypothetical protein